MHSIAIIAFTSFFWLMVIYWLLMFAQRSIKRISDESDGNYRRLLQVHDDLTKQLAKSRDINKLWADYNRQRIALTEELNQSE